MVINHNIAALNTLSNLQKNTAATQDSLQKLSTGSKINKAADDASGLAISQKMQAQINGLDQAQENVSNGNSLVQTAEGALGNTQDILQKMRTLAVQAQNDTQNDTDKGNLQDQADALTQEINRISTQTAYNTKDVFGNTAGVGLFSQSGLNIQIGADSGQTISLSLSNTVETYQGAASASATATATVSTTGGNTVTATVDGATATYQMTYYTDANLTNQVTSTSTLTTGETLYATFTNSKTGQVLKGSSDSPLTLQLTTDSTTATTVSAATGFTVTTGYLGAVDASALGVGSSSGTGATALSLTNSQSINTLQNAIDTVSKLRSKLGAYQNRMSYASDTLDIESQNLTSAESTITDTDVAQEMMTYTKNNILVQSAQAMLAQANQLPQGMLSLLKS